MIRQTPVVQFTPPLQASFTFAFNLVSTRSDLKALPVIQRVGTVLVLGRFAPADGLGGIYWWNAFDTRSDNGDTVITPA